MKEEKGEKLLFFRVLPIAIAFLFVNIISFINRYGQGNSVTGFSISSTISEAYYAMPKVSKIFLLLQWVAMISLLTYLLFRDKNIIKTEKEVRSLDLKNMQREQKTDLDTLYNILQEKGKIRISAIARAFRIDKDLAIEWAKTLEEGKLAIIDYPSFGGSVLKLRNKKKRRFF